MVVGCNDMTLMLHVVCMWEMILHPKIHTHSRDIWKTDGAWSCDMWLAAAGRNSVSLISACWFSLWLFVSRISVSVWCHLSFISCYIMIICFVKTQRCIYSKYWCINMMCCVVVHVQYGVHVCQDALKTLLHNGLRQRNIPPVWAVQLKFLQHYSAGAAANLHVLHKWSAYDAKIIWMLLWEGAVSLTYFLAEVQRQK